jgi:pyridoxal phosphate enzyme (YggS family)
MSIRENYEHISERVRASALACGRDPSTIRIVAVSKTFPASDIQEAISQGITLFGENRVQEAKEKAGTLEGDYELHLIGHLQSNKAKDAVRLFSLIHSIDKFETAEKVNREAAAIDKVQDVLIQVNTSGETTKSGINPDETESFYQKINNLQNLRLIGLMTIGPMTDNVEKVREAFAQLAFLKDELNKNAGTDLHELSMGMSGDFEIAVQEGATLVRIGSAIFGKRSYA